MANNLSPDSEDNGSQGNITSGGIRKLIKGLGSFKSNYFPDYQELFEHLSQSQSPKVLFITCSDSRIDPNLITQTDPGELFVIRNAGNIIPPFGATNGGEGATVEYAVQALGVEHIIICGHSHCGAMKGLLHLNKLQKDLPLVFDWLKYAEATRRLVVENYGDLSNAEMLEVAIAENVLTQIENLRTYPVIHSRLYQDKLQIYGWIYMIETGEVLAYDAETHTYLPPQSQIDYESDQLDGARRIQTSAPPVACELPYQRFLSRSQPSQSSHSNNGGPKKADPVKKPIPVAKNPSAAPWLSPDQAARIYSGS
jgi:carbonic anhydrase